MKKAFLLLVSVFIIFSCTKTEEKPDVIVDIKVSKNGYSPNDITVKQGQVVLFRITATDEGISAGYGSSNVGHCFYIMPPYDVLVKNIKKGETKEVKVKMVFPGDFLFTCPYCSGIFPTKGDLHVK
ncbi:Cupredoxin-like domain-containing protein [Persephonella hydrogeniphila]|uniref:Cupredoxin-like domain-containing protein n=1 Tax=Persephonella hydrogeniphila TaxID=198703 RepID=A0A285NEC6_9AQUI|nr:cupredoxin domain-containing protein [Persephonella hydrogeniphila]SNZ07800.1 Cupredoxin-like domain-containing protein [Persephonella hydrogeniphila]